MCNRGCGHGLCRAIGKFHLEPVAAGALLLSGLYFRCGPASFSSFTSGCGSKPRWAPCSVRRGGGRAGLTQLQALSTALASTIGTGSIAGWLPPSSTAGRGRCSGCGCQPSGHDDRMCRKDPGGALPGEKPRRRLAGRPHVLHGAGSGQPDAGRPVFPVLCGLPGGGNVVQANSIAASLEAAFGWDRLAVGLVVAVLTGLVILGGIGRIGRVSETLVPCMALLFIGGGVMVLICHRAAIPEALERIVTGARSPPRRPWGRHRVRHGRSHALRRGPRCIHKRGRHGLLRHRPRRLQRTGTGRAGDVGHF